MSKRGKFIKIVFFFAVCGEDLFTINIPKCGHGMVGTVGRGRVAAIKESTIHSFTTIEVSDRCRKTKVGVIHD